MINGYPYIPTSVEKVLITWLIMIAIMVVLWALAAFSERRPGLLGKLLFPIVIVLILIGLVVTVHAHDHGRPSLDSWYQGLRSPAGAACCDGPAVDAVHLADVDWESRAGRYRVRIDGQWVDVPPDAVLTVPNRDGRTLVWPTWSDGQRTVRCFMPGSMS